MLSGNIDEPAVPDGFTEKAELVVTALPIEILGGFVEVAGRVKLKEAAVLVVVVAEEVLFKLKEKLDAPVIALSKTFGGSLAVEGD